MQMNAKCKMDCLFDSPSTGECELIGRPLLDPAKRYSALGQSVDGVHQDSRLGSERSQQQQRD